MIIKAGLVGLVVKHKQAQKGILLFFENLIRLSKYWPTQAQHTVVVGTIIQQIGGIISFELFRLLSGESYAYAIDESNGSITDVLWLLKEHWTTQFKVRMSKTHDNRIFMMM
jgi:hypothetical protein